MKPRQEERVPRNKKQTRGRGRGNKRQTAPRRLLRRQLTWQKLLRRWSRLLNRKRRRKTRRKRLLLDASPVYKRVEMRMLQNMLSRIHDLFSCMRRVLRVLLIETPN